MSVRWLGVMVVVAALCGLAAPAGGQAASSRPLTGPDVVEAARTLRPKRVVGLLAEVGCTAVVDAALEAAVASALAARGEAGASAAVVAAVRETCRGAPQRATPRARASTKTGAGAGGVVAGPYGLAFVRVPAGTAVLQDGRLEVTIERPFLLGQTEVTQAQWRAVMKENPSHFVGCDACPVELVSWDAVQEFLARLNALDPGQGYRLPSEAEWEYAARAGDPAPSAEAEAAWGRVAWFAGNSGGRTHPVATKAPNGWGFFDLAGNVWEWTADCWNESMPRQASAAVAGDCSSRVVRGGSWFNSASSLRPAIRNRGHAGLGYNSVIGFRVARTLSP